MALIITINISDAEEACLLNDLLDIDDWVQKAVKGKINNCKERLIREWYPKLFANPLVKSIPASETLLISFIFARPDYKNRAARDVEDRAARDVEE